MSDLGRKYDNHPGVEMIGCKQQVVVTARSARSMNGYACGLSGGHCLPWLCPLMQGEPLSERRP